MWGVPPMQYKKKDNMVKDKQIKFVEELRSLINRHNLESISNTPDFILTEYLMICLDNFDVITNTRTAWFKELEDTKTENT